MAFFWVVVSLDFKNPSVVLVKSSIADVCGADVPIPILVPLSNIILFPIVVADVAFII